MRALVLDDSTVVRKVMGDILSSLGFEVLEAGDGQQALEVLEEHGSVDVAMVDWNMPRMNGHEFLLAFRALPEHADTRVVMVTTENEMDYVMKALDGGANEYVMKPFDKEVILDKLGLIGLIDV